MLLAAHARLLWIGESRLRFSLAPERLKRQGHADVKKDERGYGHHAGRLSGSHRDFGKPRREKYSQNFAEDCKLPENRHDRRPTASPLIVGIHNRKRNE